MRYGRLNQCFGFRRQRHYIITSSSTSLAREFFARGSTPRGSPSLPVPTPVPVPAPAAAPVPSQATATGTNLYATQPGVTRAVTRSQVPSPAATDYRTNRNNCAALAGLFAKQHAPTAAQARISREFGYRVQTRPRRVQHRVCLCHDQHAKMLFGGRDKGKISNTIREAMGLPQVARWKEASDKYFARLEKHGVYELVPITAVLAGQRVVGTRWANKIKADGMYKSRLVVQW